MIASNSPRLWLFSVLLIGCVSHTVSAADQNQVRDLFFQGKFSEAESIAAAEVESGIWNVVWPQLLIQCQLEQGKYDEAALAYEEAIKRFRTSMPLILLGIEALRSSGQDAKADQEIQRFTDLLPMVDLNYSSKEKLVATGRFFTMVGDDARKILELFYDRVRERSPTYIDAYVATAELALSKGDFGVAAQTLRQAKRHEYQDPAVDYLLARALESSDSEASTIALNAALEKNPKYVPALRMVAENQIAREQYGAADKTLAKVLTVNPKEPLAIALQAVLAHLEGDYDQEKKRRDQALQSWPLNPAVDHLIGKTLSQKYRFREGARYQRSALTMDPSHAPAQFQLASDLLRLGEDDNGWQMAQTVANNDPYNVVAYNLMTLYDRVRQFRQIERDGILLKMEATEADVYGQEVIELLTDARRVLCEKYDVQPNAPIVVEIFPQQKDFAIRTFGLPGGQGFLGVCFGRVITANSPASQGARPTNWKSVLWHEFCHVVTLEKTSNRMPRWLSEGISVYEETQRNESWGQSMTPTYRSMILGEDLTPVSQLSAAFLQPPSPVHLQFAYFESSLVVEYLIEEHGLPKFKKVLDDLAAGLPINDALEKNIQPLARLDAGFREYARSLATSYGADAEWKREDLPQDVTVAELRSWVQEHPNNYWGRIALAKQLMSQRRFPEAQEHLEHLIKLGIRDAEPGGVLELLASAYRNLERPKQEKEILREIVANSSDALPSVRRLIELDSNQADWNAVVKDAVLALEFNPLLADVQEMLADAAMKTDQHQQAATSLRALSQMDPIDPAGLHFRLAQSLQKLNQPQSAKRAILEALQFAPRYKDAHQLLLDLVEDVESTTTTPSVNVPANRPEEPPLGPDEPPLGILENPNTENAAADTKTKTETKTKRSPSTGAPS